MSDSAIHDATPERMASADKASRGMTPVQEALRAALIDAGDDCPETLSLANFPEILISALQNRGFEITATEPIRHQ